MSHPKNIRDKIISRYIAGAAKRYLEDEFLGLVRQLLEVAQEKNVIDLVYFFEGIVHFIMEEFESAISKFQASLSQDDQLPHTWYELGSAYRKQKDYVKADEAYRKAIELDDKFAYPWNGIGNIYNNQKDYEKAEEAYRKAIELDGKYSYPWNGLGSIFMEQKNYEKAEEAYRKAIELDDKFPYPWYGLGNIYSNQNDYEKAEEAYRKTIELDDKSPYPWYGLGNIYSNQKDYEKAEAACLKAVELDDKSPYPWNGLGNIYKEKRDYNKAEEAYRKAIELDGEFAHAFRNYGLLLQETNHLLAAKKHLAKATDLFEIQRDLYFASIAKNNLEAVDEKLNTQSALLKVDNGDDIVDKLKLLFKRTSDFENDIFSNQKNFETFVKGYSKKESKTLFLEVLRRWNSYTPIIADNYHISKGGGYFLNVKGFGIVIDPGFNFIDNFKGAGHDFDEIDAVIISHAHNDHTSDLESILTLLNTCNKRRKGIKDFISEDTIRADLAKEKKCDIRHVTEKQIDEAFFGGSKRRKTINLYFTKSVLKKFGGMLQPSSRSDYSYHIVEKGEIKKLANDMALSVIAAKHNDVISDQESVGFVFEFDETALIYTGDTGWNDEAIIEQYVKLREALKEKYIVLLAHLGGFKDYESKYLKDDTRDEAFYKNHLGRLGLGSLVEVLKPNICLISEFGEELRLHRMELTEIFADIWGKTTRFFPADIGLKYDFQKKAFFGITRLNLEKYECTYGLIPPNQIRPCLLRKDYSLHYFDSKASFQESDLIQVLIEQFDRSSKMIKERDRPEYDKDSKS